MDTGPTTARSDFYVVGIGASAGGLGALEAFFANVEHEAGCAYIIVTHLDPTHKSMMPELLARQTRLPVKQVEDGVQIEPNCVYTIPPNRELGIDGGKLVTVEHPQPRGFRMPINTFFSHLAREYEERAVAVVLSGSGSDGAEGVREVKSRGGLVLCQSPEDAKYEGMPTSTISSGMVDQISPARDLPRLIARHVRHDLRRFVPRFVELDSEVTPEQLELVVAALRDTIGHDFKHYKPGTMRRRVTRRVEATKASSIEAYIDLLRTDAREAEALFTECLINVTKFFRDPDAFRLLETSVVPRLIESMSEANPVRIWLAGCSSGEEAYSVAMLLHEEAQRAGKPLSSSIFATDVDAEALAAARTGLYESSQVVGHVSPERIERYFTRADHLYKVNKAIRDLVVFSLHDLVRNPPLSRIDLICCRNVFIYFSTELQQKILSTFHYALRPSGYLFLGSSESLGSYEGNFDQLGAKEKIYRKNAVPTTQGVRPLSIAPSYRSPVGRIARGVGRSTEQPEEAAKTFFLQEDLEPSVLINDSYEVLYLAGPVRDILLVPIGAPSYDIFALVPPSLHTELKATIYSCIRNRASATYKNARFEQRGAAISIDIIVRPVVIGSTDTGYTAVTFARARRETGSQPLTKDAQDLSGDAANLRALVVQQSEELEQTKMVLANVVRDAEATYQELTSSNEELMSTNEELQSTSQELETSREELQALNEELETVNSELRRKIEDLTAVNNDVSNLVLAAEIGTVVLDEHLRIKSFTPAATKVFNLIQSDIGRPIGHISHRLRDAEVEPSLRVVLAGSGSEEREVATTEGRRYVMRTLPYRTADNRIEGAVLTFVDVSALRLAEVALEATERRLGGLVSAVPDTFAVVSREMEILDYKLGAAGLSLGKGIAAGVRLTRTRANSLNIREVDLDRFAEAVSAVLEDGVTRELEITVGPHGGSARLVELRVAKASTEAVVCVFRDLTEKRENDALRIANATAEKVSRAKSDFIANMSHELRTPLNGILGFAEILNMGLAGPLNEKQSEYATNIHTSGRQLLQLVEEILDLAKVESETITLQLTEFPLHAVVEEVLKSCEPLHTAGRIEISTGRFVREAVVRADRKRLRQVLFNLVGNSIKFTPEGGIIEVDAQRCPIGGIEISVADSGLGIPEEDLDRIFGRFEQVEAHRRSGKGGSGIGLSLVKNFVELHGGRVTAKVPGIGEDGSKFTVWLPPERFRGPAP